MTALGHGWECLPRSVPCNCRTPCPSSALHAENPLASISKQMPQQGLKPLPHRSLTGKIAKREKGFAVKSPPCCWVWLVHHQVGSGCYRTPTKHRCITSGRFAGRRSTAVWMAGPSGAPPGAGWPTPESLDDGDLTRKCNGKSPTIWRAHYSQLRGGRMCAKPWRRKLKSCWL